MLSRDEITARALRLSGRPANPYTGTLNDPFQEAQSRYMGPGWEQFFGGLQKTEEDAYDAGKNYRVNWSGFGNAYDDGGRTDVQRSRYRALAAQDRGYNLGSGDLNPLEEQAQKEFLLSRQANDAIEQAKAEKAAQDEYNDSKAERTNARLAKGYEDFSLSSAFVPANRITRTPGVVGPQPPGSESKRNPTYSAQPDPNLTPEQRREAFLQSVPPKFRMQAEAQLAAFDMKRQEQDLALRKQAEVERENKAKDAQNAPFVAPKDASGNPIMGEALLKTLPEAKQKLVTAVLEGRQAIPSGTALKDPYWKGVLETANLIDPNFDAVNYNARANTRKDFTSGAMSKQINAINTVVGHLHDLAGVGEQLGNGGLDWVNALRNKVTTGGSKRGVALNNFETLKEGVANELMRTWRQVGAGTEKEIEDWKAQIGASKSPDELRGAFKTIGGMLESKLSALDNQYKTGMGTDKVSAITPESRARLDALQGIQGGMVKLLAPDGKSTADVPAALVDHYLKLGAKRVGG